MWGEIEEICGVLVSLYIIKSLLECNWVWVVGYWDVLGWLVMFVIIWQFFDYFDFKSLEDLLLLLEIKDLDKFNEELVFSDVLDLDSDDDVDENDVMVVFGVCIEGECEVCNEEIFVVLDEELELDDFILMSIDKVDFVNVGFEEEFCCKLVFVEGIGEYVVQVVDEDE